MVDTEKLRNAIKHFQFICRMSGYQDEPCTAKDLNKAVDELCKLLNKFVDELQN